MGTYTIRELENLSGIKAHTIRIWEKRYKLISPHRTSTNIRTYCDAELKKLLNISILNRKGFKISKIASMSADEINGQINQLSQDVTSAESQIESLTLAMIDFDEFRFEQVLAKTIIQFGFEEAVIRILYPFFTKVGVLWQTGSINPAQEHFISNLIRQKLFTAIDGLISAAKPEGKQFVFFLPEGELHEIGLLFCCYLVKKRGHNTIYLGQSVPLNGLKEVVLMHQVDYLVTAMTSSFKSNDLNLYIWSLSDTFHNNTIFLSGNQSFFLTYPLPGNIVRVSSPIEFLEEIEKKEIPSDT
jgi:DNA-binding transcriptional MerR regulator